VKSNKTLLISVIVLSIFGIIMIYSSSNIWAEFKYNNAYKYVIHQALFFIIGLATLFIVSKVDYNIYKKTIT
jgi:cell division protein FtsW